MKVNGIEAVLLQVGFMRPLEFVAKPPKFSLHILLHISTFHQDAEGYGYRDSRETHSKKSEGCLHPTSDEAFKSPF